MTASLVFHSANSAPSAEFRTLVFQNAVQARIDKAEDDFPNRSGQTITKAVREMAGRLNNDSVGFARNLEQFARESAHDGGSFDDFRYVRN